MNRSKDLDNIAPDDEVVTSQPVEDKLIPKDSPKKNLINTDNIKKCRESEDFSQKVYEILGHTKSPFSSFLVKPKVLKFTEQDDSETIFLAVRSHWITNLSWIIVTLVMIFTPLLFSQLTFLNFFSNRYQLAIILFWYLITFIYSFENFLSWYFDLYIVTDERVVDIDFNNLLNKHFAETDISMIQDVSSSVRGVLGTFFNYGDVLIQTASEINQINFTKVPNPEKIIKLLKELRDLEEIKGERK